MRIPLEDLRKSEVPNLWHNALAVGILNGQELEILDEQWVALLGGKVFEPAPTAKPREQWPGWAKLIALASNSQDKGVGDTVARTIGPIGGEQFKAWYLKITGHSCGCSERQYLLNQLYPFS